MNILVIGNGFDLAHGLPTKYGDFLEFCDKASNIYTLVEGRSVELYISEYLDGWKINKEIKDILRNAFISRKLNRKSTESGEYCEKFSTNNISLNEFYHYIKNNAWIGYFSNCVSYIGENWIDFESEISRVIQCLDDAKAILINGGSIENIQKDKQEILVSIWKGSKGSLRDKFGSVQAIEKFAKLLNTELEKLIRALEIYIAEFVGEITISQRISNIEKLTIGHVLSFNYSDTYKNFYGTDKKIGYDYVHGRADVNNTIESNNMVLGIDEYLPEKRKNKEIEFITFKKYYQRIYKGTGCEYKDWIYKIKESSRTIELKLRSEYPVQIPFIKFTNDARHYLYIFGHSLDVSDKDILKDLILNDNIYTTVFYYNKDDLGKKIANLVKIIGQDELIRRTGGSTRTIEFKVQ